MDMTTQYNGNGLIRKSVMTVDFLILNSLLAIFQFVTTGITPEFFDGATKMTFFVANASLFIGQYFYSTIIHVRRVSFIQVLKRTLLLSLLTTCIFFLSIRLLENEGGKYLSFFIIFELTFYAVLILSRFFELEILKYYRTKGRNNRTVVFIGSDPAILEMYRTLTEDPSAGYHVKGYYANKDIVNAPKDFKHLGTMEDLNKNMDSTINDTINGNPNTIDDAFVSLSHDRSEEIIKIMQFCDKNVIHFYYLPRQFGEYKLHLEGKSFMGRNVYTNRKEPLTSMSNRIVKRTFDIFVSGCICLCMLPFLPIIALCIKLQSPGPLFFKQARTGLNGKIFECYKFRSMHVNKDADTAQATKDDPRKFAFGNFMRKTNIDEFPQFLNVLKGDMSIVGPRPHMLHHTEVYGSIINKYMIRHFAKPGITGWAQVTGFRGETKELWQMEERIRRDIWYIENWSFWLDLRIIYLTAKSIIIPDKNAY